MSDRWRDRPHSLLARGVHVARYMGPKGEIVLEPATSAGSLVTILPIVVPLGSNHIKAAEDLWDMLDAMDPLTDSAADELRRKQFRIVG